MASVYEFIELKNIIVCTGTIAAAGHSSVVGYGDTTYYVIQLYLCDTNTPVILNYDNEDECMEDFNKIRNALIPQKCEA